jgi:hypothetical protein
MLNAGMLTSTTAQWNTPPQVVADIVRFMGTIDLDPCADPEHRIPAEAHFSRHPIDGLLIPWRGRVYMNPPYGREIGKWVLKARTEPLLEIVMLLPARTDTQWFQPLFVYPICFIAGRLHFSQAASGAPFPSVLVYRGPRIAAFCQHFRRYGRIVSTMMGYPTEAAS